VREDQEQATRNAAARQDRHDEQREAERPTEGLHHPVSLTDDRGYPEFWTDVPIHPFWVSFSRHFPVLTKEAC
jgi:hypothetical protein